MKTKERKPKPKTRGLRLSTLVKAKQPRPRVLAVDSDFYNYRIVSSVTRSELLDYVKNPALFYGR